MSVESFDKLKQSLIATYQKFGDDKALIRNGLSYSGNQISNEIENETELGIELIDSIIKLTIDLLSRDKINI